MRQISVTGRRIKNRGIRIAVLYTTYYPLPTNPWYNTYIATYIAPFQSRIGPTMQSCASPGLFSRSIPVATSRRR